MKRGSTLFLRLAVLLIGAPVLAICIFALPSLAREAVVSTSEFTYVLIGIVIIMYGAAVPFFIALFQAFKLLGTIDKNFAFSERSVQSLKTIKYCALSISGLYVVGLPLFLMFGHLDDAPGVVLINLVFIFAPLLIAVFAAVLQRLLQEAIQLKSENELTV